MMSFTNFSYMFYNLTSMRLSQFNFNTEKFVPDSNRGRSKRNSIRFVKWSGSQPMTRGLSGLLNIRANQTHWILDFVHCLEF
jgi:hypothetical protein